MESLLKREESSWKLDFLYINQIYFFLAYEDAIKALRIRFSKKCKHPAPSEPRDTEKGYASLAYKKILTVCM